MKKILIIVAIFYIAYSQSEDATLTIYKDGSALIKQPVAWSVPAGNSYVTWGNLPSGIHRDTPFLNIEGVDVISQRFNDNIFTGVDYFNSLKGQEIQVKPKDGKLVKGVLLEISPITLTLEHQSGIICFNRSELEYIRSKKADLEPHTFHPY